MVQGLPWRSSGWDSEFPLQGAWVPSLVGELRSHKPCSAAKKIKIKKKVVQVPTREVFSTRSWPPGRCGFNADKPSASVRPQLNSLFKTHKAELPTFQPVAQLWGVERWLLLAAHRGAPGRANGAEERAPVNQGRAGFFSVFTTHFSVDFVTIFREH